jgi:hypothetical protein
MIARAGLLANPVGQRERSEDAVPKPYLRELFREWPYLQIRKLLCATSKT